jgi:putative ABC transport system permease protein
MGVRAAYLVRNLLRNPLRGLLTCAAVGLPVMIFVLSVSVIDELERYLDNSARQLRLAVGSKISMVNPLPVGYRAKIESLDPTRQRILAVCGITWIGGRIKGDQRPLSTLCIDHDTFPVAFPEFDLTPGQLEAWNRDRQAIIVGEGTARQFGWKVGDRITIQPSVPPYKPIQFHVVADSRNAVDKVTNWARRDYLAETRSAVSYPGSWVSFFFVKCASAADMAEFRARIDELFAGTPEETFTQDEKAFMAHFITQQFDLPRNLSILALVTVFVAVMAATNTMSMNFRDRLGEFATLKAMGFPGRAVCALILIESLLLCGVGGLLGAATPYVLFTHTPLRDVTVPLIQYLEVRPDVCLQSLLIALAIGLLAGAWPAWAALRLKVVAALRTLE